jgi:predicted RNase H-like HicB family nuclease
MKLSYPAVFYPWDKEDGDGYTVEVPDLPGCVSQGNNLAEAILMGTEAASGWVLTWLEKGRQLPPASPLDAIIPDEEIGSGFVSALALDLNEHARKYGRKPVAKDLKLEIPAYLSTFAETHNVNLTKLLQDSLSDMYQRHIHA